MSREQVIQKLRDWASAGPSAEDFDDDSVKREDPELHALARAAFGSWSAALGATLTQVLADQAPKRGRSASTAVEDEVVEAALDAAPSTRIGGLRDADSLYFFGAEGHLNRLPLSALPAGATPRWEELPPGGSREAWPEYLAFPEKDDSFFALASDGTGGSLFSAHFARWTEDTRSSRVVDRILGIADCTAVTMFPRRDLRLRERVYAFTTDGQIKASDAEEYAKRLGNEVIDVVTVRDGERAISMTASFKDSPILMASSNGKAIVFSADEVRSQGRKAQGVRGILLDDGATAVSAFAVSKEQLVLVTAQGFIKRMLVSEFRPQGRGGAGLQTCRLQNNDAVVAVLQASINDDVLLVSAEGLYLRTPVWSLPPMGRAARGEQRVAPRAGDAIINAIVVAPGA